MAEVSAARGETSRGLFVWGCSHKEPVLTSAEYVQGLPVWGQRRAHPEVLGRTGLGGDKPRQHRVRHLRCAPAGEPGALRAAPWSSWVSPCSQAGPAPCQRTGPRGAGQGNRAFVVGPEAPCWVPSALRPRPRAPSSSSPRGSVQPPAHSTLGPVPWGQGSELAPARVGLQSGPPRPQAGSPSSLPETCGSRRGGLGGISQAPASRRDPAGHHTSGRSPSRTEGPGWPVLGREHSPRAVTPEHLGRPRPQ